jgi:hypothetical protein
MPFNDIETDNFTNNLNQRIFSDIQGNLQQFHFHLDYKLDGNISFSTHIKSSTEENFSGIFLFELNQPNFFGGDTINTSKLAINNNRIDASNSTRTQRFLHKAENFMLSKSGIFSFATSFHFDNIDLVLQLDKHFGKDGLKFSSSEEKFWTEKDFSVKYDKSSKIESSNQEIYIEPDIGGKLGFRWGIFNMGLGASLATFYQKSGDSVEKTTIAYPYFSMGISTYIAKQTKINFSFLTLSYPLGKLSISYEL